MPTRHRYTYQIPSDFRTRRRKGKTNQTPCKLHYQIAVYQTCKLRYHTLCKLDHQTDSKLRYQRTHQTDCKLHYQETPCKCHHQNTQRTASSSCTCECYERIVDQRMIIRVTIRLFDELMITIPTFFHCS